MMLDLVPARTMPTVTTAISLGLISRATTVCSRVMMFAAMTTGSTVASGREAWPPDPKTRTLVASLAAMRTPSRWVTIPAGCGPMCWPSTTSGRPKRGYRPSATIAAAPSIVSSAGWATTMSVPRQWSRASASRSAAPTRHAVCASWPQACMIGTSPPSASVPRAVLA
ncbi:hypothetical protein NOGI109294_26395 [Nocardiopsis gilva]